MSRRYRPPLWLAVTAVVVVLVGSALLGMSRGKKEGEPCPSS